MVAVVSFVRDKDIHTQKVVQFLIG
jgi:hypothetical protein